MRRRPRPSRWAEKNGRLLAACPLDLTSPADLSEHQGKAIQSQERRIAYQPQVAWGNQTLGASENHRIARVGWHVAQARNNRRGHQPDGEAFILAALILADRRDLSRAAALR